MDVGAVVTDNGIISIQLLSGIMVDITINQGIRVFNEQANIIIALSPRGDSAALIHPSGCVYEYGSRVEITAPDVMKGITKYAKIYFKGISFTSEVASVVYLTDQAGTRTTTGKFSDLSGDFTVPVFLENACYGQGWIRDCVKVLKRAKHYFTADATEHWVVNGIRVSQNWDGLVRVDRGGCKYQIRTSPMSGSATITTPTLHTTASIGHPPAYGPNATGHLFVKRAEKRLHTDGRVFMVRNAGLAAGFDEYHQLKVY